MPITLETSVPDDAPLTAGQKAARTKKRNELAALEAKKKRTKADDDRMAELRKIVKGWEEQA